MRARVFVVVVALAASLLAAAPLVCAQDWRDKSADYPPFATFEATEWLAALDVSQLAAGGEQRVGTNSRARGVAFVDYSAQRRELRVTFGYTQIENATRFVVSSPLAPGVALYAWQRSVDGAGDVDATHRAAPATQTLSFAPGSARDGDRELLERALRLGALEARVFATNASLANGGEYTAAKGTFNPTDTRTDHMRVFVDTLPAPLAASSSSTANRTNGALGFVVYNAGAAVLRYSVTVFGVAGQRARGVWLALSERSGPLSSGVTLALNSSEPTQPVDVQRRDDADAAWSTFAGTMALADESKSTRTALQDAFVSGAPNVTVTWEPEPLAPTPTPPVASPTPFPPFPPLPPTPTPEPRTPLLPFLPTGNGLRYTVLALASGVTSTSGRVVNDTRANATALWGFVIANRSTRRVKYMFDWHIADDVAPYTPDAQSIRVELADRTAPWGTVALDLARHDTTQFTGLAPRWSGEFDIATSSALLSQITESNGKPTESAGVRMSFTVPTPPTDYTDGIVQGALTANPFVDLEQSQLVSLHSLSFVGVVEQAVVNTLVELRFNPQAQAASSAGVPTLTGRFYQTGANAAHRPTKICLHRRRWARNAQDEHGDDDVDEFSIGPALASLYGFCGELLPSPPPPPTPTPQPTPMPPTPRVCDRALTAPISTRALDFMEGELLAAWEAAELLVVVHRDDHAGAGSSSSSSSSDELGVAAMFEPEVIGDASRTHGNLRIFADLDEYAQDRYAWGYVQWSSEESAAKYDFVQHGLRHDLRNITIRSGDVAGSGEEAPQRDAIVTTIVFEPWVPTLAPTPIAPTPIVPTPQPVPTPQQPRVCIAWTTQRGTTSPSEIGPDRGQLHESLTRGAVFAQWYNVFGTVEFDADSSVVPSGVRYYFALDGNALGTQTRGVGKGWMAFNAYTNTTSYYVAYRRMFDRVSSAYVYRPASAAGGGAVSERAVTLFGGPVTASDVNGFLSGAAAFTPNVTTYDLDDYRRDVFLNNGLRVVLESPAHTGGEIDGRCDPSSDTVHAYARLELIAVINEEQVINVGPATPEPTPLPPAPTAPRTPTPPSPPYTRASPGGVAHLSYDVRTWTLTVRLAATADPRRLVHRVALVIAPPDIGLPDNETFIELHETASDAGVDYLYLPPQRVVALQSPVERTDDRTLRERYDSHARLERALIDEELYVALRTGPPLNPELLASTDVLRGNFFDPDRVRSTRSTDTSDSAEKFRVRTRVAMLDNGQNVPSTPAAGGRGAQSGYAVLKTAEDGVFDYELAYRAMPESLRALGVWVGGPSIENNASRVEWARLVAERDTKPATLLHDNSLRGSGVSTYEVATDDIADDRSHVRTGALFFWLRGFDSVFNDFGADLRGALLPLGADLRIGVNVVYGRTRFHCWLALNRDTRRVSYFAHFYNMFGVHSIDLVLADTRTPVFSILARDDPSPGTSSMLSYTRAPLPTQYYSRVLAMFEQPALGAVAFAGANKQLDGVAFRTARYTPDGGVELAAVDDGLSQGATMAIAISCVLVALALVFCVYTLATRQVVAKDDGAQYELFVDGAQSSPMTAAP